ncbi:hypothetical protein [Kallipyga massiliensis]|uniref:Ppx/GppA phosphatase family protein n=1 Tax=Kallipyga massiliensis TaxID=1472764 RepID=UPI000566AFDD|nr:hypothetical protein [Kallipyga massiliensis]
MSKDYLSGVIDIGSNTIRLNLYRPTKNAEGFKTVVSKKTFAGLASYLIDEKMTESGIQKASKTLKKFKRILDDLEIDECYAFATAAIRNASNAQEILKNIEKESGIRVELVSGQDEGYFSYLGLCLDLGPFEEGYVIDIGGGSTEVTLVRKGEYISTSSIPEGSLSLHRAFVKDLIPTVEEYRLIKSYVVELLERYPLPLAASNQAFGVGGTIRAVGNLAQEINQKEGNGQTTLAEIEDLSLRFLTHDSSSLKTVLKVTPERLHTQLPGMIILQEVMKTLSCFDLTISQNGVREGYLFNKQKEV